MKIDDEIEKKNAFNKYLNSEPNKKIENNENQFSNSGSYFYPKKINIIFEILIMRKKNLIILKTIVIIVENIIK